MHPFLISTKPFTIVAYSFGTLVALELMALLERAGYDKGNLILIDGAPSLIEQVVTMYLPIDSEKKMEIALLFKFLSHLYPINTLMQYQVSKLSNAVVFFLLYILLQEALETCDTFENKIDFLLNNLHLNEIYSKYYLKLLGTVFLKRFQAIKQYRKSFDKIASQVYLFKAKIPIVSHMEEDFRLSELCQQEIVVNILEGDHVTILENMELSNWINKIKLN